MHEGAGGGGEEGLFGRVAKIRGLRMQTFSHGNEAESIDTFCVSMIKYNENKCEGKGEADECCQK